MFVAFLLRGLSTVTAIMLPGAPNKRSCESIRLLSIQPHLPKRAMRHWRIIGQRFVETPIFSKVITALLDNESYRQLHLLLGGA
jgi:hypothetical protein